MNTETENIIRQRCHDINAENDPYHLENKINSLIYFIKSANTSDKVRKFFTLTPVSKAQLMVVLTFAVAILTSWIPDLFPKFFGDWLCKGTIEHVYRETSYGHTFDHNSGCNFVHYWHGPTWHWGWRHWMFFVGGLALFAFQISRFITILTKEKK